MMYGIAAWNIRASDKLEHERASYELSTKLRAFKDMGFQAVSLSRYAPYPVEEEEIELLRNYEAVTVHIGCPADPDELRQVREIHRRTGLIRWVSFDAAPKRSGDLDLECTVRCLMHALGLLSKEKIGVLIENWMFGSETFRLIKKEVGRRGLGILLDLGHLNLYSKKMGMRADEYINRLPLDIHEIHLHDNDGVQDLHLPLAPRQGSLLLAMEDVVAGLKKKGFDGVVTLEVMPRLQSIYIKDEEGIGSIIRTRQIFEDFWNEDKDVPNFLGFFPH